MEGIRKLFYFLASIAGIVALGIMVFTFIYAACGLEFLEAGTMDLIVKIQFYATVGGLGAAALGLAAKKWFFFIPVALIVAAAVILSFFPAVADQLISYIPKEVIGG